MKLDLGSIQDVNALGELYRAYVFDHQRDMDHGCYNRFDVRPGFKEVDKDSQLGLSLILDLVRSDITEWDEEWAREVRELCTLVSDGELHAAWFWDGDGVLLFVEADTGRKLMNSDCKKSYGWQFFGGSSDGSKVEVEAETAL